MRIAFVALTILCTYVQPVAAVDLVPTYNGAALDFATSNLYSHAAAQALAEWQAKYARGGRVIPIEFIAGDIPDRIEGGETVTPLANTTVRWNSKGQVVNAVVKLNRRLLSEFHWDTTTPPPSDKYDVLSAMRHEVGHAVGHVIGGNSGLNKYINNGVLQVGGVSFPIVGDHINEPGLLMGPRIARGTRYGIDTRTENVLRTAFDYGIAGTVQAIDPTSGVIAGNWFGTFRGDQNGMAAVKVDEAGMLSGTAFNALGSIDLVGSMIHNGTGVVVNGNFWGGTFSGIGNFNAAYGSWAGNSEAGTWLLQGGGTTTTTSDFIMGIPINLDADGTAFGGMVLVTDLGEITGQMYSKSGESFLLEGLMQNGLLLATGTGTASGRVLTMQMATSAGFREVVGQWSMDDGTQGVIVALPEPSSFSLAGIGLMATLLVRSIRKRPATKRFPCH